MRSLRRRLLIGTAAGTTGVLLASGILLYSLIERALWHEFDASLAGRARAMVAVTEQEDDEIELEFDEARLPEFEPSERAEFYQVWIENGRVRARSPSLGQRDLELIDGALGEPAFKSVVLPDGRAGRLVGLRFTPRHESNRAPASTGLAATLVIGRETAGLQSTLARIQFVMAALGCVAVLVSLVVLAWCVKRGLKPVDRLAGQIAAVGERDLGTRLPSVTVPFELLPVVDRLNDLFGRLECAFQRERRFTADVAHELRTPLAGARSMLEVGLSREREAAAYRQVMAECLAINDGMHRMVENLLSLARADAKQLPVSRQWVDLAGLIEECWRPHVPQAAERGLQVEWHVQEGCRVETDRGMLALVLQNLLGNGVAYADEGGRITMEAIYCDAKIAIAVSNTGSRLSQSDADRVFDRFWRGDASRGANGQHCGIGLSLCKALVELLGGSIVAESTVGGVFAVTVRLAAESCRSTVHFNHG